MEIYEVAIDTPEKECFVKARDLTNLCVTACFHHAYFYRYEQEVKTSYVQKQIVRYWHEGDSQKQLPIGRWTFLLAEC